MKIDVLIDITIKVRVPIGKGQSNGYREEALIVQSGIYNWKVTLKRQIENI